MADVAGSFSTPVKCDKSIIVRVKRKDAEICRDDPIPRLLIERVQEYIPDDFVKLLNTFQYGNGLPKRCRTCTWIHADIMDDNIMMEPCSITSCSNGGTSGAGVLDTSCSDIRELKCWRPSHILDFGNMSIGDPICDLITLYLDVFRGDSRLLHKFL